MHPFMSHLKERYHLASTSSPCCYPINECGIECWAITWNRLLLSLLLLLCSVAILLLGMLRKLFVKSSNSVNGFFLSIFPPNQLYDFVHTSRDIHQFYLCNVSAYMHSRAHTHTHSICIVVGIGTK